MPGYFSRVTKTMDSFETIVEAYYAQLFRFALSVTKSEADAADLTQQTFYVWANKGHQLRESHKVKTWLFTTLYRIFLMGRRRSWRFCNDEFNEAVATLEAEPVLPSDWPEALVALGQLEEKFRAPVALYYLEEFSYAQIAETLQTPIGTVKSRIARGIARLRTILMSTGVKAGGVDTDAEAHRALKADPDRDLSIAI